MNAVNLDASYIDTFYFDADNFYDFAGIVWEENN
jgi:hypothetical protein